MAKELTTALIVSIQTVEWTSLTREKGTLRVAEFKREPIGESPEDHAPDAESARAERIRTLCRDVQGQVHAGLPSADLLLRIVNLPNAEPGEMREMVRLQLDKVSPFPLDDMVFSHEILTHGQDLSRVLMVAARRSAAEEIVQTLNKARLRPARMDAAVMGWQPLLRDAGALPDTGRHINLLVHADGADLWITDNGDPVAIRPLRAPDVAESDADWGRDVANEIRHTLMALELEHGHADNTSIAVWHTSETAPDWAADIQALHNGSTEFRPLEDLPPLSEGLARRAAQRDAALLDLTPEQWRVTERDKAFRKRMKRTAQLLTGLWALGMAIVFGGLYAQETHVRQRRDTQEEWAKPANEVRDLRARIRMIGKYMDADGSALECLREVVRLLPDGIELTSFAYRKAEGVKISGQADSVNQVYDYKTRMDESVLFSNADLSGPRYDGRRKKHLFDMDLALPEETP